MDSPVDNTAVIRMKRDFDAFLSASSRKNQLQGVLSLSPTQDDDTDSQSGPALSLKTLLEKEKEEKKRKVEVIAAKSTIAKLETEINYLKTSNKRARIEFDKDLDVVRSEKRRENDKIVELKSKLQYLSEQEKAAREELAEVRQELEQLRSSAEIKQLALNKEKLQLEDDLQQAQEQSWEKMTELRNQLMRTQMELQICQTELEETKVQLKMQLKRSSDTTAQLKELEEFRLKSVQAEQKIKELEDQMSQHEDNMAVTRAMKDQLDKVPDMERELEKLREENKYYKETEKNTMLLEEQIDGLTKKLKRTEERMADYTQLQLDNESMRINLEQWQGNKSLAGTRNPQSPIELSRQVAELQSAQMLTREEFGKLQSRLNSSQAEVREMVLKYQNTLQELNSSKASSQQQQELIKKLQRKLLLVSKEREGYKRILDSYESEVTVNVGALQASRVQQLEELVESYRTQNEALEAEVGKSADMVMQTKTKCAQLESSQASPKASGSSQADKKAIQELKEKVIELELEIEKRDKQINVLEARIEQRKLQGDYDPTKTKVLHFTMNPSERAQRNREEEIGRLREENEKLKHRLKLLEESGGTVEDLTLQVEKKLKEPDSSKAVEELKNQLTREELRNKRLMEAFKKTSQEFREVCYQLTGYKIDIPCASQYRLTNMYAESPQDYLLFAHSTTGETQMLQTSFSETVQDLIELYLIKQDSIPAFLSSVTLELFNRRTMCVG